MSSRERKEIPAFRSACTAIPARMTVAFEASIRPAIAMISSVVRKAPRKAAGGSPAAACGKKLKSRITAKPAPALTPMMLGLARSLPVTLCSRTPETESPTPARIPCSNLGSRREYRISDCVSKPSCRSSPPQKACPSIAALPNRRESSTTHKSSRMSVSQPALVLQK